MAQATSGLILGVIRKFELMLTRRAVNMLGGGLRSLSAFLVINVSYTFPTLSPRFLIIWAIAAKHCLISETSVTLKILELSSESEKVKSVQKIALLADVKKAQNRHKVEHCTDFLFVVG